jgi:hypothetical protein
MQRSGRKSFGKLLDNTRRIEKNARVGYHYVADPGDASPLGVLRFEAPEYDNFNDEDLLSNYRAPLYKQASQANLRPQYLADGQNQSKPDLDPIPDKPS